MNKTVTDFGGIYTDIPPCRYAPDPAVLENTAEKQLPIELFMNY